MTGKVLSSNETLQSSEIQFSLGKKLQSGIAEWEHIRNRFPQRLVAGEQISFRHTIKWGQSYAHAIYVNPEDERAH